MREKHLKQLLKIYFCCKTHINWGVILIWWCYGVKTKLLLDINSGGINGEMEAWANERGEIYNTRLHHKSDLWFDIAQKYTYRIFKVYNVSLCL